MYFIFFKVNSFNSFCESGRAKTIADRVVEFLKNHPDEAFTQAQLASKLELIRKSSICYPVNKLFHKGIIDIPKSFYDKETNRVVGAYQITSKSEPCE
jgi:hypothetical protein